MGKLVRGRFSVFRYISDRLRHVSLRGEMTAVKVNPVFSPGVY
jgi:hypothetical protein